MTPMHHDSCNTVLAAPKNWDAEKNGTCLDLPVVQGAGFFTSFWEPSDAERKAIAEGQPIRLTVIGATHPPVWVEV